MGTARARSGTSKGSRSVKVSLGGGTDSRSVKGSLRAFSVAVLPRAVRERGLTARPARGLGLWGVMTPFVGRHEELGVLRSRVDLADGGRGQVVAIVGEAGVGKSRLIYELAPAQHLPGWRVLETSGISYGQAISYLPVIALLKGYFALQDQDDLRQVGEKVTETLLTLDADLQPALPAVLSLLDVPVEDAAWRALDQPQRRRRTLDAVRRLLLREARARPLLLVFEDLHWIDSQTQAVLDSLVEALDRRAFASWSAIARNTSTRGAAR